METKKIIVVTSKGNEEYGNYMIQLISDNRRDVDAVLWKEEVYEDSVPQMASNQHVVFVGNSTVAEKQRIRSFKYDKGGIKIGWLGSRAVVFTSTKAKNIKEAFVNNSNQRNMLSGKKIKDYLIGGVVPGYMVYKDVKNVMHDATGINMTTAVELFVSKYLCDFLKVKPVEKETAEGSFPAADEIYKFKELRDDGIITQEEFEAKKKQLLGL